MDGSIDQASTLPYPELHYACANGQAERVKQLLDNNADVDEADPVVSMNHLFV